MVDAALDLSIDSGMAIPAGQDTHYFLTKPAILRTLLYFRQATTSQLRRLHYEGTKRGQVVRASRHLKRMADHRHLRRVWGVYGGFPEYVYMLPGTKARAANQHTLDITELYVRIFENTGIPGKTETTFDAEPWRWYKVGPTGLKPDAYIDTGQRYWLEMDEGTEYRAALTKKMRQYVTAYENWAEQKFPPVLFVCHDTDRARFINNVIQSQSEPELFSVCLFDQFLMRVNA